MPEPLRSIAVVTAAGSAERFGGKKLLADVGGEPMLDRTIRCLLKGGVSEIIVVVGTDGRADFREVTSLADRRVHLVENREPERGMFSSIQEAVRTASGDVLLVLPGDMPFVRADTVRLVLAEWTVRRGIVSPRYLGKRGHPVALPLGLRDEILATPATSNLHEVIKRHLDQRTDLDVDDPGIVKDVDTQADLFNAGAGEGAPVARSAPLPPQK